MMDKSRPQVIKAHYFRKKYDDLNRFISYWHQIDLVNWLRNTKDYENTKFSILEVGKGNGTVSDYLKRLGFAVTTVDVDSELEPDHVADVRKLPFPDGQFDLVMACEVLEHIPFEEAPHALTELKRVAKKYVLLSLPYRSTGFELILRLPLIRKILKRPFFDLFLRLPLAFGGIKTSGQHYWEIDCCKFSLRKIKKILSADFRVIKEVRPVLNYYHHFFLLEKK